MEIFSSNILGVTHQQVVCVIALVKEKIFVPALSRSCSRFAGINILMLQVCPTMCIETPSLVTSVRQVPAFHRYERNGLSLTFHFATRLAKKELHVAMNLCKQHMKNLYDASGYGWDDSDKHEELTDRSARFLIVRDEADAFVGFANFRFTLQVRLM